MAIENGMYVLTFGGPMGVIGGGVVVLRDGTLQGGDSMVAYVGDYQADGDQLSGQLQAIVHSSVPGMAPIFGSANATVNFSGALSSGSGTLIGTSPQAPGVQLQVKMRRFKP